MKWSDKEIKLLKKLYPNTNNNDIAKILKCNYSRIVNKAFSLGLKKSQTHLKKMMNPVIGTNTRYKKGNIPHNKNKKWDEVMPICKQLCCMKTTFKKGNLPHNTKENGYISIRKDKNGNDYKFIRLDKSKWIPLHVYNWKQVYGEIPKDKIVVFKNKDKNNCSIDNLELISRVENMNRNTIHRYPVELKSTIRTLNKLKKTIYGKEQNARP